MEIIKAFLYIAASCVMLAAILLCPQVCGACSVFYVSILTSFLGMDVVNMIKSTKLLPPGEYRCSYVPVSICPKRPGSTWIRCSLFSFRRFS